MNISIFGLGYVGSVSSACFSLMGHNVIGVDNKEHKNVSINSGQAPIFESGLDELLSKSIESNRLSATSDVKYAVENSDISIICVGTPSKPNGSVDISYIINVCTQIAEVLVQKKSYHVIVIRSTIPPGTIENSLIPHIEKISGLKVRKDFGIGMNPEFLREGTAIDDFFDPQRIVIGAIDQLSYKKISEIYEGNKNYNVKAELFNVPIKNAEMCKYVDNSFHAMKVVFGNEVGVISKNLGIDSRELMEIFCKDRKLNLSPYYFRPGFSFGGSCLPKDLKGLNFIAKDMNLEVPLLNSVINSNKIHTNRALEIIVKTNKTKIAFLGLSFKDNTDDIRENPIINIINELLKSQKYDLSIHDPIVDLQGIFSSKKIKIITNLTESIKENEVFVLSNNSSFYNTWLSNIDKILIDLNKTLPSSFDSISLV